MIRQLLRNGQITLPKEAVKLLHLKEQDFLEINFDAFGIHLRPLIVQEFTDAEYERLARKLDSLKRKKKKGKVYSTTVEARGHLERLMRQA